MRTPDSPPPAEVLLSNRAIILEEQRLLLLQRASDDSFEPDEWEVPGGKVDEGEDVFSGLIREVDQETGFIVEVKSPFVFWHSELARSPKYAGKLHLALFHICRVTGGELQLSSEHNDFTWVSVEEALEYRLREESRRAIESGIEALG